MHVLRKGLKWLALAALAAVLAAGLCVGNQVYDGLLTSPWDRILGIPRQWGDLAAVHRSEADWGWEPVEVTANDGAVLSGTYVPRAEPSHRTVILLHGLYANRAMCLSLVPMYQEMDYNVLLIDLRGHGESGGAHTMWGLKEMDDLAAWLRFLRERDPAVRVGLHGISLGAALAILESAEEEDFLFCIADSAYADLLALAREKLAAWAENDRLLTGMDLVMPFLEATVFFRTGRVLSDITPVDAAPRMRAPALFLHGRDDIVVPPAAAKDLEAACGSREKRVIYFEGAGHAQARALYPEEYRREVQEFVVRR